MQERTVSTICRLLATPTFRLRMLTPTRYARSPLRATSTSSTAMGRTTTYRYTRITGSTRTRNRAPGRKAATWSRSTQRIARPTTTPTTRARSRAAAPSVERGRCRSTSTDRSGTTRNSSLSRTLEDGDLSLMVSVMLEQAAYNGSYGVASTLVVFDPAHEIVRL